MLIETEESILSKILNTPRKGSILSTEDKLVISNKYILPELFTKLGIPNTIHFPEETLRLIINQYTREAGVRKLKENLFEIISEINLKILKQEVDFDTTPITITPSDITDCYLKEKHPIHFCDNTVVYS